MSKRGKRYDKVKSEVDRTKVYPLEEAIGLVKSTASAKFDETVEAAIMLGIDPKKSDQNVRGFALLPKGHGKNIRVAVFAAGEKAEEALAAGADLVGLEDLIDDIRKGKIDFDAVVAEPDAMRKVAAVGKKLGPRDLMPNPKNGTVREDISDAVKEAKNGKVSFRIDRAGIVHCPVGKASFDAAALSENIVELIRSLKRVQPPAAKGQFIKNVSLSTTMGPGVKVDTIELARA